MRRAAERAWLIAHDRRMQQSPKELFLTTRPCRWCGAPVKQAHEGRPKSFCRDICQRRHERAMKARLV